VFYLKKIQIDYQKPYQLNKIGHNLFKTREPYAVEDQSQATVKQGFLEDSNVNVVEVMVEMIQGFRNYESGQKVIMAHDGTLDKLINQVGRLD